MLPKTLKEALEPVLMMMYCSFLVFVTITTVLCLFGAGIYFVNFLIIVLGIR